MAQFGDVVTVDFLGADGLKRRPAVVVSSDAYHAQRPDLVLAVVTSQIPTTLAATDYVLSDWAGAGLRKPSVFRSYFNMALPGEVRVIGRLTERDIEGVRNCLRIAFDLSDGDS